MVGWRADNDGMVGWRDCFGISGRRTANRTEDSRMSDTVENQSSDSFLISGDRTPKPRFTPLIFNCVIVGESK